MKSTVFTAMAAGAESLQQRGVRLFYFFMFYTLDHQGSVRAVSTSAGTVRQATHYYPFGGVFSDASTNADLQPVKHGGKELDRTHGLDTYDYAVRQYDPILGVWNSPDLLADLSSHISPYAFCKDNPVLYTDPFGLFETMHDARWYYMTSTDFPWDKMNTAIMANWHPSTPEERWFIALDESRTSLYDHGLTLTRFFGDSKSKNSSRGFDLSDFINNLQTGIAAAGIPFATKQNMAEIQVFKDAKNRNVKYKLGGTRKEVYDKVFGPTVSRYLRVSNACGSVLTIASGAISGAIAFQDIYNGNMYAGGVRLFNTTIIAGLSVCPGLSLIGCGLGILESVYGERLYHYIQETYDRK